jgi:hypothetical protein
MLVVSSFAFSVNCASVQTEATWLHSIFGAICWPPRFQLASSPESLFDEFDVAETGSSAVSTALVFDVSKSSTPTGMLHLVLTVELRLKLRFKFPSLSYLSSSYSHRHEHWSMCCSRTRYLAKFYMNWRHSEMTLVDFAERIKKTCGWIASHQSNIWWWDKNQETATPS